MSARYAKRHYIDVSRILREHNEKYPTDAIWYLRDTFAEMFARDNPRFDRGRFEDACQPQEAVNA